MTTQNTNLPFEIRPLGPDGLADALALFNKCAGGQELPHKQVDGTTFERLFLRPAAQTEAVLLGAWRQEQLIGFAGGNRRQQADVAYLTMVVVSPACRRQGIGSALVRETESSLARGAEAEGIQLEHVDLRFLNPAAFEWVVPGTDGHDHPNAPGVDVASNGYLFFKNVGYRDIDMVNSFHRNLDGYAHDAAVEARLHALESEGLRITRFDASRHTGMDTLIADLGSDVWRETLLSNAARPDGGLPVLILEDGDRMCGFAGPMDVQSSGRGYFNGIGIHSEYRRRGAGKALFSCLCKELGGMGATFMTLFTSETNPARNIYEAAGFHIVKAWACMRKSITPRHE